MVDFASVKSLDFDTAKQNLMFNYSVENVQSETGRSLGKSVIFKTDGTEKHYIGMVPEKRNIVPYPDMMDYITDQLSQVCDFKLIESSVQGKDCKMYQKYLFNREIENPDGQLISPMIHVTGSYTFAPLVIELGTYRYICSNGAMVKVASVDRFTISVNDLNSLHEKRIVAKLQRGLDVIDKISNRYNEMASETWTDGLAGVFNSSKVSVSFKKNIVEYLTDNEALIKTTDGVLKNDTYLSLSYNLFNNEFVNKENETVFKVNSQRSNWDLYNDCTYLSTHRSASKAIQRNTDRMISELFVA